MNKETVTGIDRDRESNVTKSDRQSQVNRDTEQ